MGNNLGADQAAFSNLLVTFIAAAIPGDFNNDTVVDAADYVVWRKTDGSSAKYAEWSQNFGNSTAGGGSDAASNSVPEPAALIMIAAVLCLSLGRRRGC